MLVAAHRRQHPHRVNDDDRPLRIVVDEVDCLRHKVRGLIRGFVEDLLDVRAAQRPDRKQRDSAGRGQQLAQTWPWIVVQAVAGHVDHGMPDSAVHRRSKVATPVPPSRLLNARRQP
ncbi:hypothetical protein [Kutzneria buriramensis]|uniref:hypothetical protein n=1 Tax=Kutzneria buriramensis TaxID=1045776 RepID=UPI000E2393CC|nr:hypothetical protein [Kutzneria buriramensis]